MKPEAQRIAIAEACGWKGPYHPDNLASMEGWWSKHRGVWWLRPSGERVMLSDVPDYLNDLNAMHEAEKVLTMEQQSDCGEHLLALVPYNGGGVYRDIFKAAHATAAQRAEAFLRTLGKWEDDK